MRMLFVNLPVKDLEVSKRFFTAIGFELNPRFSDDASACMVIEQNVFVMLLAEERFRDFVTGEISDSSRSTEVINCLSAQSRKDVDDTIARALAAGGKAWQPVVEDGPMYGGSFADPDGHVWEVLYMDLAAA